MALKASILGTIEALLIFPLTAYRIAPMKLVPNGLLVRLNKVTLDFIGPDASSTFAPAKGASVSRRGSRPA